MNKKSYLFLLFLLPVTVFSQESSFGITGGYVTNGYAAHASYNYELRQNHYFQIALFASDNKDTSDNIEIPYNTLALNIGYYRNVFKDRNSQFHLALGGGGSIAYERINNGDSVLNNGAIIQGNTKIAYGVFLGAEPKYYLSDAFALLGVINTYLYANSDIGVNAIYVGLGGKFYLK